MKKRDPFEEIKEHIREREQWFAVGTKRSKATRARLDEWYSDLYRMIENAVPKRLAIPKGRRDWINKMRGEILRKRLGSYGDLTLMTPGHNVRVVGLDAD